MMSENEEKVLNACEVVMAFLNSDDEIESESLENMLCELKVRLREVF